MSEVSGVVQEVQTRDVSGGKKAYNIVVAGQAYGAGLYAPKCKVGDYVKFAVDESRGYKNVERGSLKVSANKPPAEALAEAAATAPKKNSVGGSFDTRQDTISRQAAMNTAIQFMQLLQATGQLPVSGAKGKGQESLELMLKQYTADFYETNTGLKYKDISPSADEAKTSDSEEASAPSDEKWD